MELYWENIISYLYPKRLLLQSKKKNYHKFSDQKVYWYNICQNVGIFLDNDGRHTFQTELCIAHELVVTQIKKKYHIMGRNFNSILVSPTINFPGKQRQ